MTIAAAWTDEEVAVTISDDGPGFSPQVVALIGEPYVTTRGDGEEHAGGLGLGFFIAKTLLERSGAALELTNREPPEHGAVIRVSWPRPLMDTGRAVSRRHRTDIAPRDTLAQPG